MFRIKALVVLMVGCVIFGGLFSQRSKSQDSSLKEEPRATTASKYRDTLRDKLKDKTSKLASEGRMSKAAKAIAQMLLHEKSDPNECEKAVIQYMRKRYVAAEIVKPNSTMRLSTECGIGMRGLPNLLFWLKGKASGLYEYSRLTGGLSPTGGITHYEAVIWDGPQEQKEALMRFALYDLIVNLPRRDIDVFVLGKRALYSNRAEEIKRILHRFGPDNKLLSDFVVNYPFMNGSHIQVRENDLKDTEAVRLPIPTTEQLLCEYYDHLLTSASQKLLFLGKVKNVFGSKKLAYLLTHISEEDTLLDESASFYQQILEISIDNRMWENAAKLLAKPAGQESKAKILDMLNRAESEIDKEKQAIGIIKKAITNNTKQE